MNTSSANNGRKEAIHLPRNKNLLMRPEGIGRRWLWKKEKTINLFHRRRKPQQCEPKEFICEVCSDGFDSSSSLTQHKTAKGLTQKAVKRKALNDPLINVTPSKRESRKQKSATESSTKVTEKGRKRTIKDFLREKDSEQKDSKENEDDNGDENEECSAPVSEINNEKYDNPVENCVLLDCNCCKKWFHSICIGLKHLDEKQLREIEYLCEECKKWTIRKPCFVFSIFFVFILSFVSHLFYEKTLRVFCLLVLLLAYSLYESYPVQDLNENHLREIKCLCSGMQKMKDTKAMFVFSMFFLFILSFLSHLLYKKMLFFVSLFFYKHILYMILSSLR